MKIIKKSFYVFTLILSLFLYDNAFAVSLSNPLGTDNVNTLLRTVITSVLGIVGSLAFLVFFAGGVMWITSGGNQDKVKKGTQAMTWAGIGIVVIFSSYAIIKLVLDSLIKQ